jgi:hypothetical protein
LLATVPLFLREKGKGKGKRKILRFAQNDGLKAKDKERFLACTQCVPFEMTEKQIPLNLPFSKGEVKKGEK